MKKNIVFIIITLIIIVVVIASYYLFSVNTSEEKSSGEVKQNRVAEKKILIGEWLRTDSDYLIKIATVNDDGSLLAQYFNPNPINVGSANWETISGDLKIIIELSDVNYPGSTYTLNYLPDKDMLAGEYYQAVEGLTFYVEFSRYKAN